MRLKIGTFAALAAAITVTSAGAAAQLPADSAELLGPYAGSYVCQDGEHGFYLDLEEVIQNGDGTLGASGTLGMFPVLAGLSGSSGSVAGSFSVSGTISADGVIALAPGDWLVQPEGYGAAHLEGTLSQRGDGAWQIAGKPVIPGNPDACSDLIATRFLP